MHRGTSTHRSSQTLDPSYTQNKFTHTHFNHAVSLHSYGLTDPWTLAHVPSCTDPCAPSPIFLPSFTSSLAMRLAVWWVPGSPFCLWATSGAGPSNLCRLPVTDFWERGKEPRQVFHKLLTHVRNINKTWTNMSLCLGDWNSKHNQCTSSFSSLRQNKVFYPKKTAVWDLVCTMGYTGMTVRKGRWGWEELGASILFANPKRALRWIIISILLIWPHSCI